MIIFYLLDIGLVRGLLRVKEICGIFFWTLVPIAHYQPATVGINTSRGPPWEPGGCGWPGNPVVVYYLSADSVEDFSLVNCTATTSIMHPKIQKTTPGRQFIAAYLFHARYLPT